MHALEPLLARNESFPSRESEDSLACNGRQGCCGAKSPGQGPADLGPSGSLQLPVRTILLEGEVGTESAPHHRLGSVTVS